LPSIFSTATKLRRDSKTTATSDDLPVARIAGTFGVRGELKCDPTSAGRVLFSPGTELRCVRGTESATIRIAQVRPHAGRLLIRIAGVEDADSAKAYAGAVLYAPRARIPLQVGEHFVDDLVGCAVRGVDGAEYGTVERVEHYPSSDMLIVDGRMIPMVRAIVTEIDVAGRRVVVDPPPGLLD
jgi:16S rRNA processing protein RimM